VRWLGTGVLGIVLWSILQIRIVSDQCPFATVIGCQKIRHALHSFQKLFIGVAVIKLGLRIIDNLSWNPSPVVLPIDGLGQIIAILHSSHYVTAVHIRLGRGGHYNYNCLAQMKQDKSGT
jgi:hypothetical protein